MELNISQLIIEQYENNFISSFPSLDRFDKAKKPSEATVPLGAKLMNSWALTFQLTGKDLNAESVWQI